MGTQLRTVSLRNLSVPLQKWVAACVGGLHRKVGVPGRASRSPGLPQPIALQGSDHTRGSAQGQAMGATDAAATSDTISQQGLEWVWGIGTECHVGTRCSSVPPHPQHSLPHLPWALIAQGTQRCPTGESGCPPSALPTRPGRWWPVLGHTQSQPGGLPSVRANPAREGWWGQASPGQAPSPVVTAVLGRGCARASRGGGRGLCGASRRPGAAGTGSWSSDAEPIPCPLGNTRGRDKPPQRLSQTLGALESPYSPPATLTSRWTDPRGWTCPPGPGPPGREGWPRGLGGPWSTDCTPDPLPCLLHALEVQPGGGLPAPHTPRVQRAQVRTAQGVCLRTHCRQAPGLSSKVPPVLGPSQLPGRTGGFLCPRAARPHVPAQAASS